MVYNLHLHHHGIVLDNVCHCCMSTFVGFSQLQVLTIARLAGITVITFAATGGIATFFSLMVGVIIPTGSEQVRRDMTNYTVPVDIQSRFFIDDVFDLIG